MSEVTIIIVNHNTQELTCHCLDSVISKTEGVDYEIVVVDNASTDGSQKFIKSKYPQVRLIDNDSNFGFGKANNRGIEDSSSKYVFLLNSDTVLVNNAINQLCNFMECSDKSVGCVGGQLYYPDLLPQLSYAKFPSLKGILIDEFLLHYRFGQLLFPKLFQESHKINELFGPTQVPYVSGADMFIRRDVLERIGLFDNDFFLYFEETELSYRMANHGFKSFIVPTAKIIHLGGASGKKMNYNYNLLFRRSEFLFYKKCYGVFTSFVARLLYIVICLFNGILKVDLNYLRHVRLLLGINRKSE